MPTIKSISSDGQFHQIKFYESSTEDLYKTNKLLLKQLANEFKSKDYSYLYNDTLFLPAEIDIDKIQKILKEEGIDFATNEKFALTDKSDSSKAFFEKKPYEQKKEFDLRSVNEEFCKKLKDKKISLEDYINTFLNCLENSCTFTLAQWFIEHIDIPPSNNPNFNIDREERLALLRPKFIGKPIPLALKREVGALLFTKDSEEMRILNDDLEYFQKRVADHQVLFQRCQNPADMKEAEGEVSFKDAYHVSYQGIQKLARNLFYLGGGEKAGAMYDALKPLDLYILLEADEFALSKAALAGSLPLVNQILAEYKTKSPEFRLQAVEAALFEMQTSERQIKNPTLPLLLKMLKELPNSIYTFSLLLTECKSAAFRALWKANDAQEFLVVWNKGNVRMIAGKERISSDEEIENYFAKQRSSCCVM